LYLIELYYGLQKQKNMDNSKTMNTNQNREQQTIAIIGLGLLGGCLALSIRKHYPNSKIIAYARNPKTIQTALQKKIIDYGSNQPKDILPQADLTILCIPIPATINFVAENAKYWKANTTVTDVSSVKTVINEKVKPILKKLNINFIGSHPMAGKEKSGLAHSVDNLYDGAIIFITQEQDDNPEAYQIITNFWKTIKAKPHNISCQEHDQLVARTSHTLHYISSATVTAYMNDKKTDLATGGAFRDFSRIAASTPSMWCEIAQNNQQNVLDALQDLQTELKTMQTLIQNSDWNKLYKYLDNAKNIRQEWFAAWQKRRNSEQ